MTLSIFAVIAFIFLLPILYFIPMGLSFKAKVMISSIALVITYLGILASEIFPVWQIALILILLVVFISYILETRFGKILLQSANEAATAEEELPVETVEQPDLTSEKELEEKQEVNVELEDIAINTAIEKEDSLLEPIEPSLEEIDESNTIEIVQPLESTDGTTEAERNTHELTTMDELEAIEEIGTFKNDSSKNVNDVSEFHNVVEQYEDELEERNHLEEIETIHEEDNKNDEADELEQLLENRDLAVEDSYKEEIPHVVEEDYKSALEELEEEKDMSPMSTKTENRDSQNSNEVNVEEIEFSLQEEEELEVLFADILQDQPVLLEDNDPTSENQEEHLSETPAENLDEIAEVEKEYEDEEVMNESVNNNNHFIEDLDEEELFEGNNHSNQPDTPVEQEERIASPVQQQLIHTMVQELEALRMNTSPHNYENIIKQYLQPSLPDRDYYTFAKMLLEHYVSSEKLEDLKGLVEELELKFISYPVLQLELELYKEYAWRNIIQQLHD